MPRKEKITVDISAKTKKPLSDEVKLRIQIGKIIKLNEELTDENRIYTEWIADVKSKWWYKLMTWGW